MNVLYITHYSELYGANKSMLALLLDLKQAYGVNPCVLSVEEGALREECGRQGIDFRCCKYYGWMLASVSYNKLKNSVKKMLNSYWLKKLYVQLKEIDFDVVYCNSSTQDLGIRVAKHFGKPLVWHLREFGEKDYSMRCIYSNFYRKRLLEKADKLIAISDSIYDHFRALAPNANIVKIYNGVQSFDRRCQIDVASINKVKFCCVGLLNEGKNQLEILRAAKKMMERGYHDFEINLIGKGDEYEAILREYVRSNSLEDKVVFWGYRTDIQDILQDMHVGIMSSKNEAFGRVTVEYMFAEMPVIGTDSGGTPEIILDGQSGYLYKTDDIDTLANHMCSYIDDKNKILEHGLAGRHRALESFSVRANTSAVYNEFKNVLHR